MRIKFELIVNARAIEQANDRGGFHFIREAAMEFATDAKKFMENHPFIQSVKAGEELTQAEKRKLLKKRPTPRKPLSTPESNRKLSTPEQPWNEK